MSELTHFIIASFGVFRLAELITTDAGPWNVFLRLRTCTNHPMLCEIVNCQYCCGIWLSGAAATYLALTSRIPWQDAPLWAVAIAGGAVAIMRAIRQR